MNTYKLIYRDPLKSGRMEEMEIYAESYQKARRLARHKFRSEYGFSIDVCKSWYLSKDKEKGTTDRK